MRRWYLAVGMACVATWGCAGTSKPKTPEEIAAVQESARVKAGNARVEQTRAIIRPIAHAVMIFRHDHNRLPANLEELSRRPADVRPGAWPGSYYNGATNDAWGHPLTYRTTGKVTDGFEIISWGEDGAEGGVEFAADLTSHD